MTFKIFRWLSAAAVIVFLAPVFCLAQPGKTLPLTYKATGTIIPPVDKTQIRVLRRSDNNIRRVSYFRIMDSTRIKGTLEAGSIVVVTFIKERVNRNIYRRVALTIEVIKLPVPGKPRQPVTGS